MAHPIRPLLRDDPEYSLVGTQRRGLFGREEVYVHIRNGEFLGASEISYGLLGEKGADIRPPGSCGSSEDGIKEYFLGLGVPEDKYRAVIEPAVKVHFGKRRKMHLLFLFRLLY